MLHERKCPLEEVWKAASAAKPLFTYSTVPGVVFGEAIPDFESIGLLKQTGPAQRIFCPECRGHSADVEYSETQKRYYIECEEYGWMIIDQKELQQWEFRFEPLARLVAESLGCQGEFRELYPDSLWNVGRAAIAGQSRPIYVGRRFIGVHADEILPLLPTGKSPLLFAISRFPPEGLPGIDPNRIFEMGSLVSFVDGQLQMEAQPVHDQIAELLRGSGPKKPPAKKRRSRAETIDALKHELHQHILSMKSMVCDADARGRDIQLPKLTHEDLAKRIGKERSAVTRAIKDKSDPMLQILWKTIRNVDAIRKYSRAS